MGRNLPSRRTRWYLLILSLGIVRDAQADAIFVTRAMSASTVAEVFIERESVRIELEIGINDLEGFSNLLPEELLRKMGKDPAPLQERLPRFFLEDLTVRADDGPPLPGFVASMEGRTRTQRDEITGEPIPVTGEEGEAVIFTTLVYPWEGYPASVSIKPPMGEGGRYVGATIGFSTYHLGLPIMDFRYLGREETAELDWGDPWYSKFRNKNLWRRFNAPINAFLYVEPYEVRVEVIVRPKDLQSWIDLGIESRETISVDRQPALMEQVRDFVKEHVNLTVDGQPVTPIFDRINFLRRTLRTSTVIQPPEELDVASATLGVIFVQPTPTLPQEATLTWDLFAEKLPEVRSAATDEAGPLPYILRPDDNELVWKNFLTNPTIPGLEAVESPPVANVRVILGTAWTTLAAVSLWLIRSLWTRMDRKIHAARLTTVAVLFILLTGATVIGSRHVRVDSERSQRILQALMNNLYHAFDFREENLIYDTLAHSVEGNLLTEIYLETRKGLELASQGGARVKVKNVELLNVEPRRERGESGFRARCTWNVTGSVGHWGHIHQRTNQYEAEFTIEPVDGSWKITGMELIEEQRLS